jgi:hypothetical protein
MRERRDRSVQCTSCLDPWRCGSARTCSSHCTLTPAACAAHSARSAPGRDTRSGQGALARRTQTGRYGRLYSRRRLCARRGADARLLLRILLELVQLLATSDSPRAKSLIPINTVRRFTLSVDLRLTGLRHPPSLQGAYLRDR